LKIIEHAYFIYKKEDIYAGLKYLLCSDMIFREYKHICIDLIRRGILENMFAIYDQDIFEDGIFQDDTDVAVDLLCMELEDDLMQLEEKQDMYLDKINHHKLHTILEDAVDHGGSDGDDEL
jgi:hypothetical protein